MRVKLHGNRCYPVLALELRQRPHFAGHRIPKLRAAIAYPEAAVGFDRSIGPVRHEIDVPLAGAAVAVADRSGCGEVLHQAHALEHGSR